MKYLLTICCSLYIIVVCSAQNSFPLYSAGSYTGGTGDYTNIANAQLKLQASSGYIRVPHISSNTSVSTVYNFETNKDVYWGEPTDAGNYFFRGRNFHVARFHAVGGEISNSIGDVTNKSTARFDVANPAISLNIGYLSTDIPLIQSSNNILNSASNLSINPFGGNVGVGTSNPTSRLTVNGSIHSKEVKVDLNVPGPDYVFAKGYKLPTLSEVENYIQQHQHLPEVPSAKEMEANGINLSEMNMLLLKKVEELTLHLIEQNKTLQEQHQIIKTQHDRLVKLENQILNTKD